MAPCFHRPPPPPPPPAPAPPPARPSPPPRRCLSALTAGRRRRLPPERLRSRPPAPPARRRPRYGTAGPSRMDGRGGRRSRDATGERGPAPARSGPRVTCPGRGRARGVRRLAGGRARPEGSGGRGTAPSPGQSPRSAPGSPCRRSVRLHKAARSPFPGAAARAGVHALEFRNCPRALFLRRRVTKQRAAQESVGLQLSPSPNGSISLN